MSKEPPQVDLFWDPGLKECGSDLFIYLCAMGEISFAVIHCVPVDANKLARAKVRGNHGTRIC